MTTPDSAFNSSTGIPADLERLRRRVVELSDTLWAAHPASELAATVTAIESLKSSLDELELSVVAELESTGGVKPLGWASTRDFCTAVAGGRRGAGPAMVHLAEDLREELFTPVADAMRDGWLSTAKAHVITRAVRVLPSTTDHRRAVAVLLDHAKRLDAGELQRAGRHLLTVIDPDGEDRRDEAALERHERASHQARFLSIVTDSYGGARIRGFGSAEDAALIRTTLMSLTQPQPSGRAACDADSCTSPACGHDGTDPRDHGARMFDALVELSSRAQTADVLPHQHGASPRLTLLMGYDDLRAGLGVAVTEDDTELSATAVRRLCCDAEVIPAVLGSASEILDVGRQSRLVTPALWRALVARDRHCRFPGCRRPPVMCHAHHVIHWIDDGETCLENLMLLCGHHHRLVHSGPWHVELTATGAAEFVPPPGVSRRTLTHPRPPPRRRE